MRSRLLLYSILTLETLAALLAILIACASHWLNSLQSDAPDSSGHAHWLLLLVSLILVLAFVAGIRRARWPWLLFGAVVSFGPLFWLAADETNPPPLPDLGPQVDLSDPGYATVLWMSKDTPQSRLPKETDQAGASPELFLSDKPAEWPAYVETNRSAIITAYEADQLGREWITHLAQQAPIGIIPHGPHAPMLQFRALRKTFRLHALRAYLMALDGNRDEAIQTLLPALKASHNLQRSTAGLLQSMIALVCVRQAHPVLKEVLRLGPLTQDNISELRITLESAPKPEAILRQMILGECEFAHETIDETRRILSFVSSTDTASTASKSFNDVLMGGLNSSDIPETYVPFLSIFVPIFFHPNRTEHLIAENFRDVLNLSLQRDLSGLQNWKPGTNVNSQWRNPVGLLFYSLSMPVLQKPVTKVWETEDTRLALLDTLR